MNPRDVGIKPINPHLQPLYSSETKSQVLENLPGISGDRFREYLSKANLIRNNTNKQEINRQLIELLKELFFQGMEDFGIDPAKVEMELCIAGSIAKGQATAFSDIDCFLIFGEGTSPELKTKIQQIAHNLFFVADKIFETTHQFSFDPIGISLSKLSGTPEELAAILGELQEEAIDVSVANARPILGNFTLFKKLIATLNAQGAYYYFNKAIVDFSGPRPNQRINIKSDLTRPIDFILLALRTEANIDGMEYDSTSKLLNKLYDDGKIDFVTKIFIEHLQDSVYDLRRKQHLQAGQESDRLENPDAKTLELLAMVSWLRGSAKEYLENRQGPFCLKMGVSLTFNVLTLGDSVTEKQIDVMFKILSLNFSKRFKSYMELNDLFNLVGDVKHKQTIFDLATQISELLNAENPNQIPGIIKKLKQHLQGIPENTKLHIDINHLIDEAYEINYRNLSAKLFELQASYPGQQAVIANVKMALDSDIALHDKNSSKYIHHCKVLYATNQFLKNPADPVNIMQLNHAIHDLKPSKLRSALELLKKAFSNIKTSIFSWFSIKIKAQESEPNYSEHAAIELSKLKKK